MQTSISSQTCSYYLWLYQCMLLLPRALLCCRMPIFFLQKSFPNWKSRDSRTVLLKISQWKSKHFSSWTHWPSDSIISILETQSLTRNTAHPHGLVLQTRFFSSSLTALQNWYQELGLLFLWYHVCDLEKCLEAPVFLQFLQPNTLRTTQGVEGSEQQGAASQQSLSLPTAWAD